jgi:anti-anti-sigma factor
MKHAQIEGVHIVPIDKAMLFDERSVMEVLGGVNELLLTGGVRNLVIDLTRVGLAGTPALRLLIRVKSRCAKMRCDFALCGLQPPVREVLKITNLDQVFRIYEDRDAAIKDLVAGQRSIA